jgi:hypothetical protein
MALKTKFKLAGRDGGYTETYIEDNTGDYNADTNPEGYGAPNLARNEVVNYVFSYLKKTAGDEALTLAANDPETSNAFTVKIPEDGYLLHTIFTIVKFKDAGYVPVAGDVRWFATDKKIKKYGTAWTEISTFSALNLETGVPRVELQELANARAWKIRNDLNLEKTLAQIAFLQCCDDREKEKKARLATIKFSTVRSLIEGAHIYKCAGEWTNAQKNIEAIFEISCPV